MIAALLKSAWLILGVLTATSGLETGLGPHFLGGGMQESLITASLSSLILLTCWYWIGKGLQGPPQPP